MIKNVFVWRSRGQFDKKGTSSFYGDSVVAEQRGQGKEFFGVY